MSEPLVCAIMLTRDRPVMAKRAVECFRAQTYRPRQLLIFDTGTSEGYSFPAAPDLCETPRGVGGYLLWYPTERPARSATIGELRNAANSIDIAREADILVHWDDDDWSHPNRIAEQVALLRSSGADVVGYNEMLFWDSRPGQFCGAWLYSNPAPRYALGTSLCYWRSTWERTPFHSTSQGEDAQFLGRRGKIAAASSLSDAPRMIASIHGGNTSNAYDPAKMRQASEWRRVPEWDEALRERMKL